MMAVLALSAIWITVFSASPGVMPHADPVYDFIIVGSGVAGSVVASRLTNGTGYRVLLLEAGEEEPWVSKIPLSTLMLQGSKYDWKYYSEPQEFSSFGMLGRKSFWPRGKMLGGSAQLNYNIFTLGWRLHYDRWVLQHGLTGWDSSSLMKYVKEMFCFPQKEDKGREESRELGEESGAATGDWRDGTPKGDWGDGTACAGGAMPLTQLTSPVSSIFAEAVQDLQSSTNDSSFGHTQLVSVHHGERWSTLATFLRPSLEQRSLHVVIQAHVTKILFEGTRAVGVEWHQWGAAKNSRRTFVRGEVILAAGAVNSPAILRQSGVGKREELDEHEIEVVVDSPGVGDNLADHMNLPVYVHINSSISINPDKLISFQNFWKYFMYREGLFTDTAIGGILTEYKNFTVTENNNLAHTAFETSVGRDTCNDEEENHDEIQDEDAFQETNTCPISSSSLEDNVVVKDMNTDENFHGEREEEVPVSLLLFNMGAVERESYAKAANLDPKVFDETYPDMRNKSREGVFLLASCMQPFSRGHVKLSHESPQHQSIQPNYLKHPSDLHCITRAFRLAERFVRTAAMQRIGAKIHYPQLHRCKTLPNARLQNANVDSSAPDVLGSSDISDEEVGCIARTLAFTGYHPIGTLKMGPSSDREAVVDLQLRVQGVDGVRVVDASVLPSHPVPAPMGIIAVFAARAADIIKEAWSPVGKIETTEPCYAGVCGEDLYQANSSSCLHYSLITSILAALAYSLPHFIARQ
ncbi:dehydrogenase mpl7 [Hyalella azteca]|uniref:Dehydrogenase mpl7 n=1 Tax=Hyalella azteca TaxID=294128 RepID=A0A8B7NAP2_HYAAZ|nr:dehydrogenase mpl7 [Hyalella azteca]